MECQVQCFEPVLAQYAIQTDLLVFENVDRTKHA